MTDSSGTVSAGASRGVRPPRNRLLKSCVYGGLIAGTVDIFAASLLNMANPLFILMAIATGALGRAAFQGGAAAMALGLVLQWLMSIIIAAIFTLAADKLPSLARRWVVWGTLYGVVIFAVMNFVVVPLSAAPFKPHFTLSWFGYNLAAMLVFGLIIAFTANRLLVPAIPRERPLDAAIGDQPHQGH